MGARNEKRKSGRKRGEAQSGSAAAPARPRRVLSGRGSLWSEAVERACACLGARERSERVTGRRQPPRQRSRRLVSKTSTRFTANCQIWTVLRGAFEATFGVGKVLRFFNSIRGHCHTVLRGMHD